MRRLIPLFAALGVLAAGCGGGGGGSASQSHSVLEVSKAFYDAGLPFTSIITGNQYVTGQVPFLPLSLNKSDLRFDVDAQLTGSDLNTHTGEVVWVFDTNAHAQQALKQVPLEQWAKGQQHITREQLDNVIVVASGFVGAPKAKLDQALSALR
jgi:hypothetical protein